MSYVRSASEFWANVPTHHEDSDQDVKSVLHRCHHPKPHRICSNLQNRRMDSHGNYLSGNDGQCKICGHHGKLVPVQSYLPETRDILIFDKDQNYHPVLKINVNGEVSVDSNGRLRIGGKFVKGRALSHKDSYNLHHQFAKCLDFIQVVEVNHG